MAITKLTENVTEGKVTLEINNGHLEALNTIKEEYDIINIEKALGFILAVVSQANGKPIKIGEDLYEPGEAIKNKKTLVSEEDETESKVSGV